MRPLLVAAALAAGSAGCQHVELQNHTLRQADTLTELQYRQILDNIAMFCDNPASLPHFSAAGTGLTNITDGVNAGGSLGWDKLLNNGRFLPFQFDKSGATFGGTSTSAEQWTTASILNPDELLLMRCVYQMVVGAPACACDCEARVRTYFERSPCYLEAMRPGWYGVGRCKDVPKAAACVGRHGTTFVWVMPEGVDALTRLTLAILDIATAVKPGEAGRVDPVADKVRVLSDRAKNLSDLISKYPGDKTDPEYLALTKDLKQTLQTIEALNKYTPEEILTGKRTTTRMTVQGSGPPQMLTVTEELTDVPRNLSPELQRLLSAPGQAPAASRDRKNFYNPLQQSIVPQTVP